MPDFQDVRAPYLTAVESSAPASPATAGDRHLYVDTNHVLRWKDSAGLDSPLAALNKWDATAAPGTGNDDSEGYSVGSRWIDTTNAKEYVCLDASTGAAVWTETTQSGGGGSFDPDVHMPWHTVILPTLWTPDASTGTWAQGGFDVVATGPFLNQKEAGTSDSTSVGLRNSSAAQNDQVSWYVPLAAGTWTATFSYFKNASFGIMTLKIDGTSAGTIDAYNASTAGGYTSSISGISVASTGKKTVQVIMATKNGSSSAYGSSIIAIEFQRTA
jgi:hypothetical protein